MVYFETMEQRREPTERERKCESQDEIKKFAERILAEPEYRKMVIAVLCASGKKTRQRVFGEALLQKLIGPPLQAKTIVTLFRVLQGAEYPGFCRDLFETAKILTAVGAVEEGMILFISLGLICFGGGDLNDKERKEVLAFLRAGKQVVNIPPWVQQALDDYSNQTLQPKIDIYRQFRINLMKKIRHTDKSRHRLAAPIVLMAAFIGLMALHAIAPERQEENYPEPRTKAVPAKTPTKTQLPAPPPAPKEETDEIHPAMPFSYAKSICGTPLEKKMFGFKMSDKQVRVTCGIEEDNEPSLEIAAHGPEGTTNCIDLDLDDVPDACGSTEAQGEEKLRMVSPPRENLDRWFKEMAQETARKLSH